MYTADELAEDSDAEKRIFKAEKAAERKAKRRKTAAPQRPKVTRAQSASANAAPNSAAPTAGQMYTRRLAPHSAVRPVPVKSGAWLACGELGHMRISCPKLLDLTSKKWYPQCCSMCDVGSSVGVNGGEIVGSDSVEQEVIVDSASDFCEDVGMVCNVVEVCGRDWEAEAMSPQPSVQTCFDSVQGRLKQNIRYWREVLKAPQAVLRTIESGYVLPLMSEPTPLVQCNQQSALSNAEFMNASLSELLANRCVRPVDEVPFICSPLSVVESGSGKKRLVVNLRHLNKFLWKQKFKYEDLRTAMLLFEAGDYLFSSDLKSGYHHVDITEIHQKYLGFAWDGSYYVFTVLPFGLSTACYMFTKLLRPPVRYWRGQGIRIVVYLDDGLGAAAGEAAAADVSRIVQSTLEQAGFVANCEKSVWQPTQRLQWLGFVEEPRPLVGGV